MFAVSMSVGVVGAGARISGTGVGGPDGGPDESSIWSAKYKAASEKGPGGES